MDRTKVKVIIQEAINQELKEIFGFGKKSTEKLVPDNNESTPVETFSMEKLKQLKTSKDIRRYAQMTLSELGRGQARVAYLVGNDKVLKVALSDNKAYQNQNEITNSKCLGSRYTPKIYDFDPRFSWILTEHVNQTKSTEVLVQKLNELTGLNQEEELRFGNSFDVQDFFSDLAALTARGNVLPKYQNRHDFLMSHSEWYQGLVKNLIGCKVSTWDFHKNNWGIRPSTGELVLLDVGFNPAESDPEKEFFKEEVEKLGFSLEKLKTFDDTKKIIDYCYEILGKPLGFGSGRMVWAIDKNKIIKVARYQPSRQNEKEFENSFCLGKKYAVEVLDYDINGFKWLIEERVDTFKTSHSFAKYMNELFHTSSSEWEELFGSASLDMFDIADIFADSYQKREMKKYLMQTNEWFRSLVLALNHCIVASHDFHDGNWGIRPGTGELILIDLGF